MGKISPGSIIECCVRREMAARRMSDEEAAAFLTIARRRLRSAIRGNVPPYVFAGIADKLAHLAGMSQIAIHELYFKIQEQRRANALDVRPRVKALGSRRWFQGLTRDESAALLSRDPCPMSGAEEERVIARLAGVIETFPLEFRGFAQLVFDDESDEAIAAGLGLSMEEVIAWKERLYRCLKERILCDA